MHWCLVCACLQAQSVSLLQCRWLPAGVTIAGRHLVSSHLSLFCLPLSLLSHHTFKPQVLTVTMRQSWLSHSSSATMSHRPIASLTLLFLSTLVSFFSFYSCLTLFQPKTQVVTVTMRQSWMEVMTSLTAATCTSLQTCQKRKRHAYGARRTSESCLFFLWGRGELCVFFSRQVAGGLRVVDEHWVQRFS